MKKGLLIYLLLFILVFVPGTSLFSRDAQSSSIDKNNIDVHLWFAHSPGYLSDVFFVLAQDLVMQNQQDQLFRFQTLQQKLIWTSDKTYNTVSKPLLFDQKLFFGTLQGQMVCLDWTTGRELWTRNIFARISSAPLFAEQHIIFGASDGIIYALHQETGALSWHINAGSAILSGIVEENGRLYAASVGGRVLAFSSSGAIFWQTSIEGTIVQSLTVKHQYLALVTYEGKLFCLNHKGEVQWYKINHPFVYSAPLIENEVVYQFFPDGYLRSYGLYTGEMLGSIYLEYPLHQTPFIFSHHLLFRVSQGVMALDKQMEKSFFVISREDDIVQSMVCSEGKIYLQMKSGDVFIYSLK